MTDNRPLAPLPALTDPADALATQASVRFVRVTAIFVVAVLVWAAIFELDRVTRGTGRVVSEQKNALVQHLEGGIIKQIVVDEGDRVASGDVLMRIENSFAEAELAASRLSLRSATLKRARLDAEASGAAQLELEGFDAPPALIAQEIALFNERKAQRADSLAVLDDRIDQRALELSERRSRLQNKRRERDLMTERLQSLRALSAEGAVARNDLLENETRFQQVLTEISDLEYQILQVEAALAEARARRRETEGTYRTEAATELTDVEFEIARLAESIDALVDRQLRFDVLAPTSGTVNKLHVTTVNGVVRPGQMLAEIVPDETSIVIDARIAPRDRAKVYPGLKSVVKVSAYDFTLYGGLEGEVVSVSPDALQDERGEFYFRVRINASADQLGEGNPVVPGMVADVDILSGKQTVLDYLLRPVRTIGANALRE